MQPPANLLLILPPAPLHIITNTLLLKKWLQRHTERSTATSNFKPALMDLWTIEGKEGMLRNIDEKFSEVFVSTSLFSFPHKAGIAL